MLLVLPTLLKDMALFWYRNRKVSFRSWADFCYGIRERFGDSSFQRKLKKQIRTRTQGDDKSVLHYLNCIETMYCRLDKPVPLTEQLDLTFENFRWDIKLYLRRFEFDTYDQLLRQSQEIEKKLREQKTYRPPPPPELGALPEVGYKSNKKVNKKPEQISAVTETSSSKEFQNLVEKIEAIYENSKLTFASVVKSPDKDKSGNEQTKRQRFSQAKENHKSKYDRKDKPREKFEKVVTKGSQKPIQEESEEFSGDCFNCRKPGHMWKDCKEKKEIFCYICGKVGVTICKCPEKHSKN